jgi:O-antigen/teichoic acid export membrane protein
MTGSAHPFTARSVRSRLLRGSAWVLVARAGTLLLGVVVHGLLGHLLTTAEFGVYATASVMSLIGAAIAQMGLDRAVVRFVSAAIGLGELGRARAAMRLAIRVGTLGAVAFGVVLAAGPGQLFADHVIDSPRLAAAMPLVAGWLIGRAVQSLLVESFRGAQRFGPATLLDAFAVDLISVIAFGALYATGADLGPAAAIGVSAAATGVAVAVAGALAFRMLRRLDGDGDASLRELQAVAWPLMVTNLAILLLGSGVDVLTLAAFRPQDVVGLYGAANKLVVLVVTPFVIFSGVIPPIIAELHAQGRIRQLERTLRVGATLAGVPAAAVLIVFLVAGPWLLELVYGPAYRDAAPALWILSVGRLVAVWAGSCGVTLMMTGHQRVMARTTVLSGVVSVVGGIVAAPIWGAIGVACATAGAQVLQNALQLTSAKRLVGVWTAIQLSPRAVWRFLRGTDEEAQENGQISRP